MQKTASSQNTHALVMRFLWGRPSLACKRNTAGVNKQENTQEMPNNAAIVSVTSTSFYMCNLHKQTH